jgi:hypothetical protein
MQVATVVAAVYLLLLRGQGHASKAVGTLLVTHTKGGGTETREGHIYSDSRRVGAYTHGHHALVSRPLCTLYCGRVPTVSPLSSWHNHCKCSK